MQSLRANLQKGTTSIEAQTYRAQVWHSILKAKGFKGSFPSWWQNRPHRLQGTLLHLPQTTPDVHVFNKIYEDYHLNYKAYESWNQAQRAKSIRHRAEETYDRCFQLVKSDYKAPLETLIDTLESPISIVNASECLVRVDFQVPKENVLRWTLNDVAAQVEVQNDVLHVESDLLLVHGQILKCQVLVYDLDEIHARLKNLWLPRWTRHADTPPEQWRRIIQFCEAFLPRGSLALPSWTYEDWLHTVKHFKTRTSSGPDGWSRSDLMHSPRQAGEELADLYNHIEQTAAWPKQWTQALVKCLEKTSGACTANGFRPITLFSIHYRAWASHRSRQCLRHLQQFSDDLQCGYAEDHEASDVWYHVQTLVELGILLDEGVHGIVGDLVKAFNHIPREPCWLMMRLLGIPESILDCWKTFLHALERRFMVRNSCGPSLVSVTGYAEGCPMSCTAMCAMDVAWHHYQRKFSQLSRPLSYVDNFEILSHNAGATLHGLGILREWCSIVDMQLDEKQLFAWSTTSEGRALFRRSQLQVAYSGRDLGGQCNYGAKIHNSVLVNRLKALDDYFLVLRRSQKSAAQRKLCISGALFPRGLHGCEAVTMGSQHLLHCGAGVMKAMKWDRAGASQHVRLGILNVASLDPGYYQLFRCLTLFRRQCLRFPGLRQKWTTFLLHRHLRETPGPFAKLFEQLHQVNWNLDGNLMLWIHDRVGLSLLTCPLSVLKMVALQAWSDLKVRHLNVRQGFQDLDGVDLGCLSFVDSHFSPSQCELLNIVRDGSFFTGSHLSKFDNTISEHCSICGVLDSPAHRYTTCTRYAAARRQHVEVVAEWQTLPDSAKLHGLASRNPFQLLAWQALCGLSDVEESYETCSYDGPILNAFLDGTCSSPKNLEIALAAWAFEVVEQPHSHQAGPVPGLSQTINRAEIFALLRLLQWAVGYGGSLHIWSDSQYVVESFRMLQSNAFIPASFEHQDLWQQILALSQSATCLLRVHKVASHQSALHHNDPLTSWASEWNERADVAARQANQQRPAWFEQVWQNYVKCWQTNRQMLLRLARFQLAVAEIDIARRPQIQSDELEPEHFGVQPFLQRSCEPTEPLFTQAIENLPVNWMHQLSESGEFSFLAYRKLLDWALQIESHASSMILVSYVELCFSFRKSLGHSLGHFYCGAGGNIFLSSTFSAELRIFKTIFRRFMRPLDLIESSEKIDLSELGVDVPLVGVMVPWSVEEFESVHDLIRRFVGSRRVKSPQGWARPMQL